MEPLGLSPASIVTSPPWRVSAIRSKLILFCVHVVYELGYVLSMISHVFVDWKTGDALVEELVPFVSSDLQRTLARSLDMDRAARIETLRRRCCELYLVWAAPYLRGFAQCNS